MTQKRTEDYEISNYGIENAQYFQGHGTSCTKFEYCSLGVGDSYRMAMEDALDQAAQAGFDIELEAADLPEQPANNIESAWEYHCRDCEELDHDNCESEMYYYVGLRWN